MERRKELQSPSTHSNLDQKNELSSPPPRPSWLKDKQGQTSRPQRPSWLKLKEPETVDQGLVTTGNEEVENPIESRRSFKKSLLSPRNVSTEEKEIEEIEEVEARPATGFSRFKRTSQNKMLYEQTLDDSSASAQFRRKRFK
jgi:hypothetical protein